MRYIDTPTNRISSKRRFAFYCMYYTIGEMWQERRIVEGTKGEYGNNFEDMLKAVLSV